MLIPRDTDDASIKAILKDRLGLSKPARPVRPVTLIGTGT
jgi:hypothetical protein